MLQDGGLKPKTKAGLIAAEDIKAGQFVVEYSGEVIDFDGTRRFQTFDLCVHSLLIPYYRIPEQSASACRRFRCSFLLHERWWR